MHFESYDFRLKTSSYDVIPKNSDRLSLYFKGDSGLTQTIDIPLNKLKDRIYENTFDLFDVGNLTLVHLKLEANDLRWKFESIDLERKNKNILHFPINQWMDTNRNSKLDILVNQGPVQLAPIYTIVVNTGMISSCSQVALRLALIGDGASTLPFDLLNLIETNRFSLSPFETLDVGELVQLQIWCESIDQQPYYCESIEVIDNFNRKNYFFLVNEWFGPNLEESLSVPAIDRTQESSIYTISIKTTDISESNVDILLSISIQFDNGKVHDELLYSSETHQIPFQKDNIDFFMLTIDDVNRRQITKVKICLINKSTDKPKVIQWTCAWIQIRDILYQRNYCFGLQKSLPSISDRRPYEYTSLEKLVDISCLKTNPLH